MGDVMVDPNDLLRQFDSVSSSQRALFAEFERQRSRLGQLLRWYDHQQSARGSELRREFDQVNKVTRRQINHRSKMVMKERSHLTHLLDEDGTHAQSLTDSTNSTKPHFQSRTPADDTKRKVYGCLLTQFKAPLTQSSDGWLSMHSHPKFSSTDYEKHLSKQRWSSNKSLSSLAEQRHRIDALIDKCLDDLDQCQGVGYDHFLQTSEPNKNAQVLAQQNTDSRDNKSQKNK